MVWRGVWSLVLLLALGGGLAAEEWELVERLERVDGFLGDAKPESSAYPNNEFFDEQTAKHWSAWKLAPPAGHTLVVDIYSHVFQPVVLLRALPNEVLVWGAPWEREWQEDAKTHFYRAHLEYAAGDPRDVELLIASETGANGGFSIFWTLWSPKGAAPTPTP